MAQEPELTLNQPINSADTSAEPEVVIDSLTDKPAYVGEIYQIYKAGSDAKSLPIDRVFAAVELALSQVPQPSAELARIDAARKIPSVQQRLADLNKDAK